MKKEHKKSIRKNEREWTIPEPLNIYMIYIIYYETHCSKIVASFTFRA